MVWHGIIGAHCRGRAVRGFGLQPHTRTPAMTNRTVFFVSDGTGITAETFGNSILAQFSIRPRTDDHHIPAGLRQRRAGHE